VFSKVCKVIILKLFYVFWHVISRKRKKTRFLILKAKRKIRILDHRHALLRTTTLYMYCFGRVTRDSGLSGMRDFGLSVMRDSGLSVTSVRHAWIWSVTRDSVHGLSVCFCRAMSCMSTAYAIMRCLSVCLSVCLSRSWVASKRIKISSKFFHRRVAKPF